MIEYIIGVIHAIDLICNYLLVLTAISLYDKVKKNLHIKRYIYLLFIIGLLGVIFIPSTETLEILLLNK